MGKENKSYRIRTNVDQDSVVNFSVDNTVDTLDILSLKIDQKNAYKLMGSNTGIVVGRVLANGGFGVPNVKVSVFIEYDKTDDMSQKILYHFNSTRDLDDNGIRYNLLPDQLDDECHQNIGTFPSKRVLLDNNNWIEVFDKYYKFTTRTNDSGDYMIYGVPTGNQTIHMDVDLSDIGILSQRPRDLVYKGYNANMFENMNKFKTDTNLDSLAQVITQDQAIYVYPFWGDTTDSELNASITRCDLNINYKFEPTCIFMGSIVSDTGENAMTQKCIGAKKQGKMDELITGNGRIEMIRKTPNGQIEQFSVKGDNTINSDGVWCYQIPMNLDYVMTDEFGKIVMTDNPNIGLPTRARVRFRLSMAESPSDASARKRAKFLIPNNPHLIEEDYPNFCETKEIDYEFGTKTKDENFRDLMWNNVYTVKSYIPRIQKSRLPNNVRHLGIKMVNHPGSNNPMPFNNLRIKFNFVYMFLCTLVKVLVTFVGFINMVITFIGSVFRWVGKLFFNLSSEINFSILGSYVFDGVAKLFAKYKNRGIRDDDGLSFNDFVRAVYDDMENDTSVTGGLSTWFLKAFLFIGCGIELKGLCETDDGVEINVTPGTNDTVKDTLRETGIATCNDRVDILYNCIENQLAQDNEVTSFNFYNDWINGVVYLPLWYRKIKKKRGNVVKDQWCSTDNTTIHLRKYRKNLKLYATNVIKRTFTSPSSGSKLMGKITPLTNNEDTASAFADDETGAEIITFSKLDNDNCYGYQCHKYARTYFKIYKGLVYEKETMLGDKVYYYKPVDYDISTGNSELVTLFATDLVLLGSLNECDIHGIPQFFKALESTTYNMPPDLLSEFYDYVNEDSPSGVDEDDEREIDLGSRITETTGADWGNLGVDQSNYNNNLFSILGSTYTSNANENEYDNGGLFYGLSCFTSYTKPKSCINLSRICELGVSLDESTEIPASEGEATGTESDTINLTPDGFISYDEIYNPDYRSMFATLNSNFLRTKLNPETGMLEYDFNHMYIDNFDGSLRFLMMANTVNGKTEKSNFTEKANYTKNYNLEQSSDAYLNFRYGNYVKSNGNKIYFYENGNTVGYALNYKGKLVRINGKNRLPRYENSFYFYFGLNEGKTALDIFNNDFFADCTNKFAADVPYDLTYQGNSWCPIDSRDGFIAFNMNIDAPYTITFTDKETNRVYYQTSINDSKILFYDIDNYPPIPEGYEKYTIYELNERVDRDEINPSNSARMIPNGTYRIEVTDAYDNVYEDNLTFEMPRVGLLCDVNPFNTRNADLLERFAGATIKETYENIANYGSFSDGLPHNVNWVPESLLYSLYAPHTIIYAGSEYFTFNGSTYESHHGSSNITVPNPNVTYYYKHAPRVGRDIYGYVGLSDISENDFRIMIEPINTNFFGDNYTGSSIEVHTKFYIIPNSINHPDNHINTNEVYYTLEDGEYIKHLNTGGVISVGDNDEFYTAEIDVNDHEYFPYRIGDTIPANTDYYIWDGNSYVLQTTDDNGKTVDDTEDCYYHIDICGYLGWYTYEGVTNFCFGVPYANERYRITIRQLCEDELRGLWVDSNNVTIINIVVYEDEFKMYINGIDYDLLSKFKTGWYNEKQLIDGKFKDGNGNYSSYTFYQLFGWDDIFNIGVYKHGTKYPKLSPVDYTIATTEATIDSDVAEMLEKADSLSTSYQYNGENKAYRQYEEGEIIRAGEVYYIKTIIFGRTLYLPHVPFDDPHPVESGEEFYDRIDYTPYTWTSEYMYDVPSTQKEDYYKGQVDENDYSYTILNYDFVINNGPLYDVNGNIVEESEMNADDVYYKDENATQPATGVPNSSTSDYTWKNYIYDNTGRQIFSGQEDLMHINETYYVDSNHTIEAVIGEQYEENVNTNTVAGIIRINYEVNYSQYSVNDYLASGDVYYKYDINTNSYYIRTVPSGYENGVTAQYIMTNYNGGEPIYYRLAETLHEAKYFANGGTMQVAYEDPNGDISYNTIGNMVFSNLNCMTFVDYKEIVDNINLTIENREDLTRQVGGAFRVNKDETILSITTQTKAKPVKYLIAGSKETSVTDALYSYRPGRNTQLALVEPLSYKNVTEIDNTKYTAASRQKLIGDGFVVDQNLETSDFAFTKPTLTNGPWFEEYDSEHYSDTHVHDGDKYYIKNDENEFVEHTFEIAMKVSEYENIPGNPSTPYFKLYGDRYLQLKGNSILYDGDVFYTRDFEFVYTDHVADITKTIDVYFNHNVPSPIYKATTENYYVAYTENSKFKHPYYVSSLNGNGAIIPPGNDIANFESLDENKDLTTTFGVHFYNKPLGTDFKMILSYINGIPAYPKMALGGDDCYGRLYKIKQRMYDLVEYTDNTETLPQGTVVTVCNRNSANLNQYNQYTASGSETIAQIKASGNFTNVFHNFMDFQQYADNDTEWLNKGDIIFAFIQDEFGGFIEKWVIDSRTKFNDYRLHHPEVNRFYKPFLPNSSSQAFTVNCIEFTRTVDNVTHLYYYPQTSDGTDSDWLVERAFDSTVYTYNNNLMFDGSPSYAYIPSYKNDDFDDTPTTIELKYTLDENNQRIYYYRLDDVTYTYYGAVIDMSEISTQWKPVDVSMPGFMAGYLLNGIPLKETDTSSHFGSDSDTSNITASIAGNEIGFITPRQHNSRQPNPDVHSNINVQRLIQTDYPAGTHAPYGKYRIEPSNISGTGDYQYAEVPLLDDDLIYTDGYGDNYRYLVQGTLSVLFDNPNINQFNQNNFTLRFDKLDDFLITRTFYTNDDGYLRHQSLYYIFDLDYTPYPLYYYHDPDNPNTDLESNLQYDENTQTYYFNEMPELFTDIDGSNYISKSKSTKFNLSQYLRQKIGSDGLFNKLPINPNNTLNPRDKFFAIACCNGYYAISPVIETQRIKIICNYNEFDNRLGDPVYITAREPRDIGDGRMQYHAYNYGEEIQPGETYYTLDREVYAVNDEIPVGRGYYVRTVKYEWHVNNTGTYIFVPSDNTYYKPPISAYKLGETIPTHTDYYTYSRQSLSQTDGYYLKHTNSSYPITVTQFNTYYDITFIAYQPGEYIPSFSKYFKCESLGGLDVYYEMYNYGYDLPVVELNEYYHADYTPYQSGQYIAPVDEYYTATETFEYYVNDGDSPIRVHESDKYYKKEKYVNHTNDNDYVLVVIHSGDPSGYVLYSDGTGIPPNSIYYLKNAETGVIEEKTNDTGTTIRVPDNNNTYYYKANTVYDAYYRYNPTLGGLHYVEDFYYLMNYRFTVHVAVYDVENAEYEDDMYSQVYSRLENTATYSYIKVEDYDTSSSHPQSYWATALKINMSSLGADAQDNDGKILDWLQLLVEDKSGGIRRSFKETGDNVKITEFNSREEMMADYHRNIN